METLILKFKSKKDYNLVKELMGRFSGVKIEEGEASKKTMQRPKSKVKSEKDLLKFAGSMKGQLISKEHLRSLAWKKRDW